MCDYQTIFQRGSGRIEIDVLAERCTFDGKPIPSLKVAQTLGQWLLKDLTDNTIPAEGLLSASLAVDLTLKTVTEKELKSSAVWAGGMRSLYVACKIHCSSSIVTDEREYHSSYDDYEEWPSDFRID